MLTERQQNILAYIEAYRDNNGYSPSIDEIREACNLSSKSLVFNELQRLQDAERISRTPGVKDINRGAISIILNDKIHCTKIAKGAHVHT